LLSGSKVACYAVILCPPQLVPPACSQLDHQRAALTQDQNCSQMTSPNGDIKPKRRSRAGKTQELAALNYDSERTVRSSQGGTSLSNLNKADLHQIANMRRALPISYGDDSGNLSSDFDSTSMPLAWNMQEAAAWVDATRDLRYQANAQEKTPISETQGTTGSSAGSGGQTQQQQLLKSVANADCAPSRSNSSKRRPNAAPKIEQSAYGRDPEKLTVADYLRQGTDSGEKKYRLVEL